jgi:hypothetical protein
LLRWNGMSDTDANTAPPEAEALFLVTLNGPAASSEVVAGLEGVQDAFLRMLWRDARDSVPEDVAGFLAALADPATWAAHGHGDGRPFWHLWRGFGEGSISVQRIVRALPPDPQAEERRLALRRALAECAAALRRLAREAEA